MTALPPAADFVTTGLSKGAFKAALTSLRAHLSELLGATGTQSAALAALGAPFNASVAKAGAYTVVAADRGKVIKCTGAWSLALSSAAALGDGFVFTVENVGAGVITIDPYVSELIGGVTTKAIHPGCFATIYCDGAGFYLTAGALSADIIAALGYTPANQATAAGANTNGDWEQVWAGTIAAGATVNCRTNWGEGIYLWERSDFCFVAFTCSMGGILQYTNGDAYPSGVLLVNGMSRSPTAGTLTGNTVYKRRKLV